MVNLVLRHVIKDIVSDNLRKDLPIQKCDGFLCTNEGLCTDKVIKSKHVTQTTRDCITMAIANVLLTVGNAQDVAMVLLPAIESTGANWADCLDRRQVTLKYNIIIMYRLIFPQVWNQRRPPWFESVISFVKPFLPTIISTVINAVQTGASMYQAMTLILVSLTQLWQCIPSCVARIARQFTEILPSDIIPLGNSVLLQILSAAIYSAFLDKSEKCLQKMTPSKRSEDGEDKKSSVTSFDGSLNNVETIALAVAERLCRIDEDNKHTDEIENLMEKAKKCLEEDEQLNKGCEAVEYNQQMTEILVSDLLMTTEGKKGVKVREILVLPKKVPTFLVDLVPVHLQQPRLVIHLSWYVKHNRNWWWSSKNGPRES